MKHINSNKSDAKKEYKNHSHQQKVDLKLMDVIIFFYNQTNVAYFFFRKETDLKQRPGSVYLSISKNLSASLWFEYYRRPNNLKYKNQQKISKNRHSSFINRLFADKQRLLSLFQHLI